MECTGLRRLVVVTGMLALGATTLVGCGGEEIKGGTLGDDTPVPETSAATRAATPSPTGTRSQPTGDLQTQLEPIAEEFYVSLRKAFVAGDPAELSDRVGPNCETCRQFASYIRSIEEQGQKNELGEFEISDVELSETGKKPSLIYTLHNPAGRRLDGGGKVVENIEAETLRKQMMFEKGEDGWVIYDIYSLD